MAWVPGGAFAMGDERFYPEERPVRTARVDGFWMDVHPVTVAQFAAFVDRTGHVTVAERDPDPALYPGAAVEDLVPGALVFDPPSGPVPLDDPARWWRWTPGASWRHPEGPSSTIEGRDEHPVTQVAHEDAAVYAAWVGKELPGEAEWERAARGGLEGSTFAWGDDPTPDGRIMANTWYGRFPWENLSPHDFDRTSPVGAFPANGYGLHDMIGNVWEWTVDPWRASHVGGTRCCAPADSGLDVPDPSGSPPVIPMRVIKGGSHLCAPSYCLRYRPAARQGQAVDTSTSHMGFRCIVYPEGSAPAEQAATV